MPRSPFENIGRREFGQRGTDGRLWYHCAITDMALPEDETIIEDDPTSEYFNQRVGIKFRDEPSYATNEVLAPPSNTLEDET